MSIPLNCTCGRNLFVPEEHVGRRVQCPGCGTSLVVPQPGTAGTPAGIGPTSGRSGPGNKILLLVLLGLLVPAVVGGIAAGWWYFLRREPPREEITERAMIPGNGQGFAAIRLAELWATPAVRKTIEEARKADPKWIDPARRMEQETGLKPDEVERFTLVSVDAERQIGWGVVKTVAPYDQRKVLDRIRNSETVQHEGRLFHAGQSANGQAIGIFFANRQLLAVGSKEGIQRCLSLLAHPAPSGSLTPILARFDEPHHVLAALDPTVGTTEQVKTDPKLALLSEVKLATLTADVAEQANLEARGQTGNEAQAKKLHDGLRGQVNQVRMLMIGAVFLPEAQRGPLLAVGKLLTKVKLSVKDNEVIGTAKLEPADLAGVLELSKLAGR